MKTQTGISLLELLTIISIALTSYHFAFPAMAEWQQTFYVKQQLVELSRLLAAGRQHSIFNGKRVSICPLSTNQKCATDWNQEIILFEDLNNNNQLDFDEKIIHKVPKVNKKGALRAFNNNKLGFNERGFAGFATGSLTFCQQGKNYQGGVLIISRNGRVRMETKLNNNDRFPKLANGNNIPCL